MPTTDTRYARAGDVHVAYQVLGESGRPDLVYLSEGTISVDSIDEEPHYARYHARLAAFSRLIRLDQRGIGMSDPALPSSPPSPEEWVEDVVAVLDAVGSDRAFLTATGDGGLTALMAAALRPDRVAGLVLVNCFARLRRAEDYPCGLPDHVYERFAEANVEPTSAADEFADLKLFAPRYADEPALREWWRRGGARGASPALARALWQRRWLSDLRGILPTISAPTLLLHRVEDRAVRVCHSEYLAEHIPGARLVVLEGDEHLPYLGDIDELVEEIAEFVTGERIVGDADRFIAGVLFTDIVSSTKRAAGIGDREWQALLDNHDAAVRRQIQRYDGREVKATGDGFLALFSGPAAALRSATAISQSARQLGLEVRCGVHVGEVQQRGADVAGLAVHIAQRVQSEADPSEVLVSRTVRDLVAGSSFRFTDRGRHRLAGIEEEWELYAVDGG